jgi:DNA-binding response OmpR family regulator
MIVEDDVDTLDITAYALRREGYEVVTAVDGKQALQRWETDSPDLVILDVMLPKVNGFEVCRRIRSESNVPVLMLTARDQDEDVVRGLDMGADDYIVKPYSHKQLLARIRTAMRRTRAQQPKGETKQLILGDLEFDIEGRELLRRGVRIEFTPIEFRLLFCLATNAGRLVSTARLVEYVWGCKEGGDANLLKTHISHIRRKLGLGSNNRDYIKNVPGTGYAIIWTEPLTEP